MFKSLVNRFQGDILYIRLIDLNSSEFLHKFVHFRESEVEFYLIYPFANVIITKMTLCPGEKI